MPVCETSLFGSDENNKKKLKILYFGVAILLILAVIQRAVALRINAYKYFAYK